MHCLVEVLFRSVYTSKFQHAIGTWAPSQYPKRRLFVRSREVSKLRDLYLDLSDRSEIWQTLRQHCQISNRYDNLKAWKCYISCSKTDSPAQNFNQLTLNFFGVGIGKCHASIKVLSQNESRAARLPCVHWEHPGVHYSVHTWQEILFWNWIPHIPWISERIWSYIRFSIWYHEFR